MPKWSKQLRVTMGKLRDTPAGQLSSRVTIANHILQKFWKFQQKKGFSKVHLALAELVQVWFSVIRFERSFGFQGEKVLRGRLYHQIISGVFWFSKTQKKNEQPPIPSKNMGCLRLGSKWIGLVEPDAGGAPFGMTNSSCFTKEFHLVDSFHL